MNEAETYGMEPYEILEDAKNIENLNDDYIDTISKHFNFTKEEIANFNQKVTTAKQAQIDLAKEELNSALEKPSENLITKNSEIHEALNKINKYGGDTFDALQNANSQGLKNLSASEIKTIAEGFDFTSSQLNILKTKIQNLNESEINELQKKLEPLFEDTDTNWNSIFENINNAEKYGVDPYETLEKLKDRLGNFSDSEIDSISKNYDFTDTQTTELQSWVKNAQQKQDKLMQKLDETLKNDPTNLAEIKNIFESGSELALTQENMFLNTTNLDSLSRDDLSKLVIELGFSSKGKFQNKSIELKANTLESKIALMDELKILSGPTGEEAARLNFQKNSIDAQTFSSIRRLMTATDLGKPTAEDALFFYENIVTGLNKMQDSVSDMLDTGFFRKRVLNDSLQNSKIISENLADIKNMIQEYKSKIAASKIDHMVPDTNPIEPVTFNAKDSFSQKFEKLKDAMSTAIEQNQFESFLKLLGQSFDVIGEIEAPIFDALTKTSLVKLDNQADIDLVKNLKSYTEGLSQTNEALIKKTIGSQQKQSRMPTRSEATLELLQNYLEQEGITDLSTQTVEQIHQDINSLKTQISDATIYISNEGKVFAKNSDNEWFEQDSDGQTQQIESEDINENELKPYQESRQLEGI
jgi:hypothetical protein